MPMATLTRFRVHRCCTEASRLLSTVHRGVAFEQRALKLLRETFSMSLTRVGGKGDGGIDLLGWWWLPPSTFSAASATVSVHNSNPARDVTRRRRIRVVGQCKAEKKKMGPNYVRELEGVMYRLASPSTNLHLEGNMDSSSSFSSESDSSPQDEPTVAILVSQSPFTKATILRAQSSPIPFLLIHLPVEPSPDSSVIPNSRLSTSHLAVPEPKARGTNPQIQDGSIATALCNMALAGTQGLLRGEMEVRWERDMGVVDRGWEQGSRPGASGKPGLWWNGVKLKSWVPEGSSGVGGGERFA